MLSPEEQIRQESGLISECLQGDRKAQFRLYNRYCKAMLNTSYRVLKNKELAEDALQEAFIEVFSRLGSFRSESTIGAWIKRIVINKSINLLKKDGLKQEELSENLEQLNPEKDEGELTYSAEEINEAILSLPTGFRTVFSLYLLEGYDHKEISSILEISESTSKTQYKRAKERVRSILKETSKGHG